MGLKQRAASSLRLPPSDLRDCLDVGEAGEMSEVELYPIVERFLHVRYSPSLKPTQGTHLTQVAMTATAGPAGSGTWSRPDLAMINLWRHKFQPTQTLDLHGFEVKRDDGCDLKSVHETLAHRRLVHYAHLVWNYRSEDFAATRFSVIEENCRAYGLGLITFLGESSDSFRIHLAPTRSVPAEEAVSDFIETRFSEQQKTRVLAWIKEAR